MKKLLALLFVLPLFAQMPSRLKVRELQIRGATKISFWKGDTLQAKVANIDEIKVQKIWLNGLYMKNIFPNGAIAIGTDDAKWTDTTLFRLCRQYHVKANVAVAPAIRQIPIDSLRNAYAEGIIDIMNHSYSHVNLAEIPLDSAYKEIKMAHDTITSWGIRVKTIAYPFCKYSSGVKAIASEFYSSGRTCSGKNKHVNFRIAFDPYAIPAYPWSTDPATQDWTELQNLINTVADSGYFLFCFGHDATVQAPIIESTIVWAQARNIPIVFLSEFIDSIRAYSSPIYTMNISERYPFTSLVFPTPWYPESSLYIMPTGNYANNVWSIIYPVSFAYESLAQKNRQGGFLTFVQTYEGKLQLINPPRPLSGLLDPSNVIFEFEFLHTVNPSEIYPVSLYDIPLSATIPIDWKIKKGRLYFTVPSGCLLRNNNATDKTITNVQTWTVVAIIKGDLPGYASLLTVGDGINNGWKILSTSTGYVKVFLRMNTATSYMSKQSTIQFSNGEWKFLVIQWQAPYLRFLKSDLTWEEYDMSADANYGDGTIYYTGNDYVDISMGTSTSYSYLFIGYYSSALSLDNIKRFYKILQREDLF